MSDLSIQITKRVIELAGGAARLRESTEMRLAAINEKWDQDVIGIGRLLRAHLFLEHFITEYLQASNPQLVGLEKARLSFAQKAKLIEGLSTALDDLIPGISRLNMIRNRMAHTLKGEITEQDIAVFNSIPLFKAMREEGAKPNKPSDDGIEVIEDFAKHTGAFLDIAIDKDSMLDYFKQAVTELAK